MSDLNADPFEDFVANEGEQAPEETSSTMAAYEAGMEGELSEPTQDELLQQLLARLETLEQVVAEKDAIIEAQRKQVVDLNQQNEGWLVEVPNPTYDERVLGVQFRNGVAFIPRSAQFPELAFEPEKPGAYRKQWEHLLSPIGGVPPTPEVVKWVNDQVEAALAREKTPTSQIAAERLRDDLGYRVRYVTAEEWGAVEDVQGRKAEERRRFEEERATQQAENLVKPFYMGTAGQG